MKPRKTGNELGPGFRAASFGDSKSGNSNQIPNPPPPAPVFFAGEESSNPALFKAHPHPYSSKPNVLINVFINWRSRVHVLVFIFICTSLAASFFPPLVSTPALRLALRAKYSCSPCFPYIPYALVSRKPCTPIPGECAALAGYFSGCGCHFCHGVRVFNSERWPLEGLRQGVSLWALKPSWIGMVLERKH